MIIYMVTNIINWKVYIGQTIRTVARRKMQHLGDTRRGSKFPFHNAIRKYGEENFTWEVIYRTDNLQDLNAAEERLIAEYNARVTGYNIARGGSAGGMFSGKRHTMTTRAKMSTVQSGAGNAMFGKSHSGETRARISASGKGRTPTAGTRARLSASLKGRIFTDESKNKMGEAKKGVFAGEKNPRFDNTIHAFRHNKYGLAFCTRYDLCKEFALPRGGVRLLVNGKLRRTGGWSMASPEYLEQLRKGMGEIICVQ